jgi:gas vesicle protein
LKYSQETLFTDSYEQERTMTHSDEHEDRKRGGGFGTLLFGGLIGAAIGLLYAPRAGEQTRRMLFDTSLEYKEKALNTFQDAKATAKSALADAQEQLGTFSDESKTRLEKLQQIGKNTLKEQKESLKTGLDEAKRAVAEPADEPATTTTSTRRNTTGTGGTNSGSFS